MLQKFRKFEQISIHNSKKNFYFNISIMIDFNELISNFDKLLLTNLPISPCVKKTKIKQKIKLETQLKRIVIRKQNHTTNML